MKVRCAHEPRDQHVLAGATPLSAFGNDARPTTPPPTRREQGKRTAMSAFIDLWPRRAAPAHRCRPRPTPAGGWTARPTGNYATASSPPRRAVMRCCWICMAPWRSRPPTTARATCWNGCAGPRRVPVAVALDLHGNVTQKMVDNADVIISFKTYPHVDMYETGEHAGRILFDWLAGGPRPALAWRRLLMTHTLRSATAEGAMREAVQPPAWPSRARCWACRCWPASRWPTSPRPA